MACEMTYNDDSGIEVFRKIARLQVPIFQVLEYQFNSGRKVGVATTTPPNYHVINHRIE